MGLRNRPKAINYGGHEESASAYFDVSNASEKRKQSSIQGLAPPKELSTLTKLFLIAIVFVAFLLFAYYQPLASLPSQ